MDKKLSMLLFSVFLLSIWGTEAMGPESSGLDAECVYLYPQPIKQMDDGKHQAFLAKVYQRAKKKALDRGGEPKSGAEYDLNWYPVDYEWISREVSVKSQDGVVVIEKGWANFSTIRSFRIRQTDLPRYVLEFTLEGRETNPRQIYLASCNWYSRRHWRDNKVSIAQQQEIVEGILRHIEGESASWKKHISNVTGSEVESVQEFLTNESAVTIHKIGPWPFHLKKKEVYVANFDRRFGQNWTGFFCVIVQEDNIVVLRNTSFVQAFTIGESPFFVLESWVPHTGIVHKTLAVMRGGSLVTVASEVIAG